MGLFSWLFGKEKKAAPIVNSGAPLQRRQKEEGQKYLSTDELRLNPGTLKYEIYQRIYVGKTSAEIAEELRGRFNEKVQSFESYIDFLERQMKGEVRRCPFCKRWYVEEARDSKGKRVWYCKGCKRYLESAPPPGYTYAAD